MLLLGSGVGVILGIIASLYCAFVYEAYSALALLPLAFSFCYPILLRTALCSKYSVFYLLFTAFAFLRYVAHPVLMAYFQEYSEVHIATQLSLRHVTNAAYMMCYELAVCTIVIFYIWRKATLREKKNLSLMNTHNMTKEQRKFELPGSTDVYKLLIFVTLALVTLFPQALSFFSFGIINFGSGESDRMSLTVGITVIFVLASKMFAHILLMMWCKKKSERSRNARKKYALVAVIGSFAFGSFYYGVNRAMILFSLLAALFIYRLFFTDYVKTIFSLGIVVGSIVLVIMTERRNYYDYLSKYEGMEKSLRSAKMTLNAYLGGVTNVAVSIVAMEQFSSFANFGTFIMELLTPIVGLNRLLPDTGTVLAGGYFNEALFGNTTTGFQIIPTIGHGMLHLGYLFAPLFDVMILWLYSVFEKLRAKTMRIEYVVIFLSISMRIAMIFGVNITIITNEISMQVLFPLLVVWVNNKIKLKIS